MRFKLIFFILIAINSFSQEKFQVYFDFNKQDLNNRAMNKLDSLISSNKKIEVLKIYGFADTVDSNKYNDSLSLKRAKNIYNYFIENKIMMSTLIEMKGFGEDFSKSKNASQNRKVVVYYKYIQNNKKIYNPNNSENEQYSSSENQEITKHFLASEKPISEQFLKAKKGDIIRINTILFQVNTEKLEEGSEEVIIEILNYLKNNPKLKIDIQGHICCNRNSNDVKLSYRRAKFIFDYLIKKGISTSRLGYKGYGSARPIYKIPEKNYEEELTNRRVEIEIIEN